MFQKKLTSHNLVSGITLRTYRKNLAAQSIKPKDSMLTLKFRLDPPGGLQEAIPFDRFRDLYGVVEDVKKGSLIYYLFAIILSGFRIFPDKTLAQNFSSRKSFHDADFYEAFRNTTGLDLPRFIPSNINKRLATEVRARNGKDNSFSKEVIIHEYKKTFVPKKLSAGTDEQIKKLLFLIADNLLKDGKLNGWQDLKNDRVTAINAIDKALAKFCGKDKIPAMAPMLSSGSSLPANTTIVFDDKSTHIDVDTPLAPYFVVAAILRHFGGKDRSNTNLRKYVQENLTTKNNSGLSWLFGSGLNLIKTQSLDDLCKSYSIPSSRRKSMQQLQEAARAIPEQALLFKGKNAISLADFRSVIGGHLDSWVANYINRLNELKDILQDMPARLVMPAAFIRKDEDFLNTTNCTRSDVELLCSQFNGEKINQTLSALSNLLGDSPSVSEMDIRQIESSTEQLNQLTAFREQIKNALEQVAEDKNSPWATLKAETKDNWKDWDKIRTLPKLNQMTGGVPDVENELNKSARQFIYLLNAQKSHFERIKTWAEQHGCPLDPMGTLENTQQKSLDRRPNSLVSGMSAKEMAIRQILHRIGNTVRNCNDAFARTVIQWFISNDIFANRKDLNRYFFNRRGSLYVSPFSTRNHQTYPVRIDIARASSDLLSSLQDLFENISVFEMLEVDAQDTFLKLNRLWLSFQLSGLSKPIPYKVAALDLPEGMESSIPADLRSMDPVSFVSAASTRKLFNIYANLLSGLQIVLRRTRFYLRTKFSWVRNNTIYYVPKDKSWQIPERYRKSDVWKPVFDSNVLYLNKDGTVDAVKTFQAVMALPKDKRANVKPLLVQLPHDWCYRLPFAEIAGTPLNAMLIQKKGSKGTDIIQYKLTAGGYARLIGPSSMKSQLDELIINSSQTTVSDMTMLVDQSVNQSRNDDGTIAFSYEPYEVTLAIPIARKILKAEATKTSLFKRIVAIDQGEAGLAFAVFNLDDVGNVKAEPVASGAIRIPSIRRLIKGVKRFRKSGQKTQKFNQKFDSTMFTLRENVVGDVCGTIVGLMQRYRAIPILETQVRNLESGSRQLNLVYKAVNARFLYSDTPMQNSKREAWWYKGNYWTIPELYRPIPQSEKGTAGKSLIKYDGKIYRPLNVFPGASVNAWMTSRICSFCGRNIWELIHEAENKGIKSFEVKSGGKIVIGGETIALYDRPNESLRRFFARRNERVPLNTPIRAGQISLQELKSRVTRNLRRPPKSLRSKDTSQSRYFCIFKDCTEHNKEHHADVNAAINIGRRFLSDVIRIKGK